MTKKTNSVPDLLSALTRNSARSARSAALGALPHTRTPRSRGVDHAIGFGRAPHVPAVDSRDHFDVLGFLSSVASGGLTNALGASNKPLFGAAESLVTGIAHLFGTHRRKTAAPVTAFEFREQQSTTVQIAASVGAIRRSGLYGDSEWVQNNSHTIAQAVKSALLESNSLSDVISEL